MTNDKNARWILACDRMTSKDVSGKYKMTDKNAIGYAVRNCQLSIIIS